MDAPLLGLIVVGQHGILTGAHDALVPVSAHAETSARELKDFAGQLAFELARRDQAARDDLGEQLLRLVLRLEQGAGGEMQIFGGR